MRAPVILCLGIVAAACGGEYEVRLSLDPPSLRDGARLAEVGVVSACSDQRSTGPISGRPILSYDLSATPPRIGELEPGVYGLFARLVSPQCEVLAAGCVPIEVESGGSGTFEVPLRAAMGPACGDGEICDLGRCVPGTTDAAIPDAGPMDSGADVAACAVPCATTNPCETASCEDGMTCVIEARMDGESCPSGQCHDGACCTGCWDGNSCQGGDVSAACGTGGDACASCTCPDAQCAMGACAPQAPFRWVGFSLRMGCYVLESGAAFCAGYNRNGQLGDGTTSEDPVPNVVRVGTESDWTMVSPGFSHTCGIRGDGELYCWGSNEFGQVGIGSTPPFVTRPRRVDAENRYDWVEAKYNQAFSIARRTDGVWVAFGRNSDNRLNVSTMELNVTVPTPIQTPPSGAWMDIQTGNSHMCGLAVDRQIYCWGANQNGQLGVPADAVMHPMALASPDMWDELGVGTNHTCARRMGEGIYCMGGNDSYILGRSQDAPFNTLREMDDPGYVPSEWVVGLGTQCAYSSTGEATCWGQNDDAEMGFGNVDDFGNALVDAPHLDGLMDSLILGPHAAYRYEGGNLVWGGNRAPGGAAQPHHGRLGLGHTDDTAEPTLLCIPE